MDTIISANEQVLYIIKNIKVDKEGEALPGSFVGILQEMEKRQDDGEGRI